MSDSPSPWHFRLRSLMGPVKGWRAEVWNPMTRSWQTAPGDPYWPPEREAEARRWLELANIEQAERTKAVADLNVVSSRSP